MRKTLIAASLAALSALPMVAAAEEAAAPSPLTGNFTIATDYRFRGISQTFKQPTLQGGVDYAHSSGLYVGTWMSNVSGNQYPNGASLEWDMYAGYKTTVGDVGLDMGYLKYYYPGAEWKAAPAATPAKFDNQELYLAASYNVVTLKYSYALSDYFGLNNDQVGFWGGKNGTGPTIAANGGSKGSTYLDLTANIPLSEKLTLVAHYGHTSVKNYSTLSYSDYKLGLNYDLNGWMLGAAYVNTNANKDYYFAANTTGTVKDTGTATLVLSVGKTF